MVRIVGAVAPVWFGAQTLRAARRGEEVSFDEAAAAVRSGFPSYRGGLLLSLGNPKAVIFAIPFLPQFARSGAPKLPTVVALAAVWAVYEVGYHGLTFGSSAG
ncbi:LysE family transporter [Embleya sp. NBC_00896]|uniref:LysE family transporter n=1 Tax=Embleya sp. NBC_00896 TaxID=2975961 RepID=UPI002F911C7F